MIQFIKIILILIAFVFVGASSAVAQTDRLSVIKTRMFIDHLYVTLSLCDPAINLPPYMALRNRLEGTQSNPGYLSKMYIELGTNAPSENEFSQNFAKLQILVRCQINANGGVNRSQICKEGLDAFASIQDKNLTDEQLSDIILAHPYATESVDQSCNTVASAPAPVIVPAPKPVPLPAPAPAKTQEIIPTPILAAIPVAAALLPKAEHKAETPAKADAPVKSDAPNKSDTKTENSAQSNETPAAAQRKIASAAESAPVVNDDSAAPKVQPMSAETSKGLEAITNLTNNSECSRHFFKPNRGFAPKGYLKGMSLVYARMLCHSERPEVKFVSTAVNDMPADRQSRDSLRWLKPVYAQKNLLNPSSQKESIRNTFTLLIGLGMDESSGRYCMGRDMTMHFSTSDSAEAGLFQASWGTHRSHSQILTPLFNTYRNNRRSCFLETFKEGVPGCRTSDQKNHGTEKTGLEWQRLTKVCPAFATEYAAVGVRSNGGQHAEFYTIRGRKTEIVPSCNNLLSQVEAVVDAQRETLCPLLD